MRYVLSFFFIALVFSCSTEQEEEVVTQEDFDPIMTPYLSLVNALENDDYSKARAIGQGLRDSEAISGVERAFKSMGRLLSESSSMYDQRTILEQMAIVMQLYIEQNLINDYPIYKFKCVNEFDNKEVFWYGLNDTSANPFIGDQSKECVELVETIKPVLKK